MEKITKNTIITLKLPWPEKALWINRRAGHAHWQSFEAKNRALNDGCAAVLEALDGQPKPDWQGKRLTMTVVAHKANSGAYDLDNFHGSLKHFIDGISATLGIDDRQIHQVTIKKGEPRKADPCVIVEVWEC